MSDVRRLQVSRLETSRSDWHQRWDAFVLAHPTATFFHRVGWQQIMEEVFRHPTYFLYAHRGEVIEGVLRIAFPLSGRIECIADSHIAGGGGGFTPQGIVLCAG